MIYIPKIDRIELSEVLKLHRQFSKSCDFYYRNSDGWADLHRSNFFLPFLEVRSEPKKSIINEQRSLKPRFIPTLLVHATVLTTPVLTKHSKERCFLYFNHLSKEFLEQMIPHLKALIQGVQNQQKYWALHHPEGGHAPLTEKALLLLELLWSLS